MRYAVSSSLLRIGNDRTLSNKPGDVSSINATIHRPDCDKLPSGKRRRADVEAPGWIEAVSDLMRDPEVSQAKLCKNCKPHTMGRPEKG